MKPISQQHPSRQANRIVDVLGFLLTLGLAGCATGEGVRQQPMGHGSSTTETKNKPADAPIVGEGKDAFLRGLVIPEDYPMKPIIDLSFGYGDDPPIRERCFSHLPPQTTGLVVCTGLQGGIFRVAARVRPNVQGMLFLRAVEPIRNIVLSAERLKGYTGHTVDASAGALVEYYTEDAMIYEGDWKDWYPARFELWLQPAGHGEAVKLVEEVYEINGWQR